MRITAALIVILAMTSTVYGSPSAAVDSGDDTVEWVKALSDSQPAVRPLRAEDSVAGYCRMSGYRDALESTKTHGKGWVDRNAWMGGFYASEDSRKKVYHNMVSDEVLKTVEAGVPMTVREALACNASFTSKPEVGSLDQAEDLKANTLQSAFFCKDLTVLHLGACAKAIPFMTELMSPQENISLRATWKKLMYEPSYLKVLRLITLRNVERVEKRMIPSVSFFDELKQEFYKETQDEDVAEDMAFNVLGVLATDGPNTYDYTPCKFTTMSETLKVLTLTNAIIDRMTATKGFIYTYPKEIPNVCDYGKFYHFWMAAFLAREAVKVDHDVVASAAAAFSLNKGYQFMKTLGGRDPRNAFTQNIFSDYNNNMRLDMAQASAGAWFGATSLQPRRKKLAEADYNRGLLLMFTGSEETPRDPNFVMPTVKQPAALMQAYSQWKKTMNADGAYLYFESKLKP